MSVQADLTQGSVMKKMLLLSLPLIGGSLIEVAYSVTDMFWVSLLGDRAVAAVGTGGLVMWFLNGPMIFASLGVGVEMAARLGAKRLWAARRALEVGRFLALVLGLTALSALAIHTESVVNFFKLNDPQTREGAFHYLRIVALGMPFYFLMTLWGQAFVAGGNSRVRLYMSMLGLGVNMVLDPLFILVFHWGTAGAALATVAGIVCEWCGYRLMARRHRLMTGLRLLPRFHRASVKLWFAESIRLLKIGVPHGVEVMGFAGISCVISRMVAAFGDYAVAAQRVGANVESISWSTATGLGVAITAMVAQNRGAGLRDRVWRAFCGQIFCALFLGAAGTVLFGLFAPQVASIFLSDSDSLTSGVSYLRYVSVSQIPMILEITGTAVFAGMGRTALPSILVVGLTLLRLPLVAWLSRGPMGVNAVWFAISLTTCLKGLIITLWFYFGYRRSYGRWVQI